MMSRSAKTALAAAEVEMATSDDKEMSGNECVIETAPMSHLHRAKNDKVTVAGLINNYFGTLGFAIGSMCWVIGIPLPGTYIFAVACVLCANSCMLAAYNYLRRENDTLRACALIQQGCGCYGFTISCFFYIQSPEWSYTLGLIGFFAAAMLCISGTTFMHAADRTWLGPLLPLGGRKNGCLAHVTVIPSYLLNTVGSFLFAIGSTLLFYDAGQLAGAYCYLIGGIFFFIAAVGDVHMWLLDSLNDNNLDKGSVTTTVTGGSHTV